MPRLIMQTRPLDELREAAEYGGHVACRECGECVRPADAVLGIEEQIFCTQTCADKYEQAYDAYIEVEMARARRAFRERTPEQKKRVVEWNVWADTVNARNTQAVTA